MLSGKRFRLKKETIGLDATNRTRSVIHVPAGAVIEVLSGPAQHDLRMLKIRLDDRDIVVFAEDIERRGVEIKGESAKA